MLVWRRDCDRRKRRYIFKARKDIPLDKSTDKHTVCLQLSSMAFIKTSSLSGTGAPRIPSVLLCYCINEACTQFDIWRTAMYNEELNHYYIDIDGIRLVFEDGQLIGWYRPWGNKASLTTQESANMDRSGSCSKRIVKPYWQRRTYAVFVGSQLTRP